MSGALQVTPDPAQAAGCAVIRVAGAAGAVGAPGFRVQRDADWNDATLGQNGWQSSDAVLAPDRAAADGPDLVLHVGWDVCRFLEGGVYEVSVPGAGIPPTGVFWPDITPPAPMQAIPAPPAPAAAPAVKADVTAPPAAQPAVPPPRPTLLPLPATPADMERRSFLVPVLMALLVALGVGGYFAYRQFGQPPTAIADATPPVVEAPVPPSVITPPPTPPTPPTVEPPAPPPPPALDGLSVPDVLARAPNVAAVTAEGTRRLNGTQRDDGLLLLEAAADRGDAAAAAVIARLYDPVLFQPGGAIPRADARQAARLYRDASRGGADVATPREALRRRLQDQAGRGDLGADLMLKDFWP